MTDWVCAQRSISDGEPTRPLHPPCIRITLDAARVLTAVPLRLISSMSDSGYWAAAWCARRAVPRVLWTLYPWVNARRRGITYRLDLRDNAQRTLYFTGSYERRYVRTLIQELRRGDIFVDVGAHIGVHALEAARRLRQLGSGRVIAFEPASDTCHLLRQAAWRSGLRNVTVVGAALGATEDGRRELYNDPEWFEPADAGVRSFYGPGIVIEQVKVTTFDSWAKKKKLPRCDLVKIDVEGAELEVIKGMTESIARHKPRVIGIEIRDYLLRRANVSWDELWNILHASGYIATPARCLGGNYLFRLSSEIGKSNESKRGRP